MSGKPTFFSDHAPTEKVLRERIGKLRGEITLAQNKRTGIDAAIASHQQTLARLESQLALLPSAARSARP